MLSFTEHVLDQKLLNASETEQEEILEGLLSKLNPFSKEHAEEEIKTAKTSTNPKVLHKIAVNGTLHGKYNALKSPHISRETLLTIKNDTSAHKLLQRMANDRLKELEQPA